MSAPRVEVFVFSYQREQFLVECLQSIVSQSYENTNIIVLDNASDFDVFNTIKKGGLEGFVNVVRQDKNIGYVGQFTYVQKNISADYAILFHDDDTMPADMVKLLVEVHENNKDLSWVGTNYNLINNEELMSTYSSQSLSSVEIYENDVDLVNNSFRNNKRSGFSSMMYSKEFLKKILLPKINCTTGDVAIKIQLAKQAPCAVAYSVYYNVRIHSDQDSYQMSPPFSDDLFLFEIYYQTNKFSKDIRYKLFPFLWVMHRYCVNKNRTGFAMFIRSLLKMSIVGGWVAFISFPYFFVRVNLRLTMDRLKSMIHKIKQKAILL